MLNSVMLSGHVVDTIHSESRKTICPLVCLAWVYEAAYNSGSFSAALSFCTQKAATVQPHLSKRSESH